MEILKPSTAATKNKRDIHEADTNPNTRGYLKFSENIRQQRNYPMFSINCYKYTLIKLFTNFYF